MTVILSASKYFDIILNVILVYLLIGNFSRRYALLLAYASVQLITGLVEEVVDRSYGTQSALYNYAYWTDEILVDLLLFLMVIVLVRQTAEGRPAGAVATKIAALVVAAAFVLPFVFGNRIVVPASSPVRLSGRWFTTASQVLNFGGAIMNLVLWGNLIGTKQRDPRMLAICAGLGIAITGEAVRYGLLSLFSSNGLRRATTIFGILTHTAGWLIWCWAFRPGRSQPDPPAVTSSGY